VQLNVSPDIAEVLEKAAAISANQGIYFVGVNHVFAALLDMPDKMPESIREKHMSNLFAVQREANRKLWRGQAAVKSGEIFYTPRCIQLTSQASKLATRIGHGPPAAGHLLLAILNDDISAPARAMDALSLDRTVCAKQLQAELGFISPRSHHKVTPLPDYSDVQLQNIPSSKGGAREAAAGGGSPSGESSAPAPRQSGPMTRDLMEEARHGSLHEATGRDEEMFEVLQILSRKTKNNVMLVGEAGVGKTQVVEGLALMLAKRGEELGLPDFRIVELNVAALMTGTQYRGSFEEKVLALIEQVKQSENCVLFIDEVHLIMGAGATDGDGMDLANLLKPELARGEFKVIGATTLSEYRKFVERDAAIERRFQMVRVEELSVEATLEVLKRLRVTLEKHHDVQIRSRTLQAAIDLTVRYMPNRNLPDKAIDVLDQACARHRLRSLMMRKRDSAFDSDPDGTNDGKVTPHSVRKVVSQITAIPLEQMTADERKYLNDLDQTIKRQLIGQDEAVARAVSAVKKSRAGLSDPNRPDSTMLFLGPTGVGKTQLAKLLARYLFGSSSHLIAFDMTEYAEEHSVSKLIGAPAGYVGHEEEGILTGAVRNAPFSILLFDEIEKAHSRIFDLFLPIFDEGRLRDARGREVSFKNCIIIITSNIGSDLLYEADSNVSQDALVDALRDHFRPEFVNRIDQLVPFYPLLAEDIRQILRLEINALRRRLREKKIGIRMYQRAYEYIAKEGYNPSFGARELRRCVDRLIATPMSERIIEGQFQEGDMVDVLLDEEGELTYRKGKPPSKTVEKA
jgi:ATP-dependent Clp protease ATP-binding subunit ClpC